MQKNVSTVLALTRPTNTTAYAALDVIAGVGAGAQVETATVVGTIDVAGAGNASVTVTAAGLAGSPLTLAVAVANNDTASQVAGKIRTALAANAAIAALFAVSGATDAIILTALTAGANDATLNIATDNGTCTGLTAAPTSANTTAGFSAAGSAILTFPTMGPSGGFLTLDEVLLIIGLAAIPAGMTTFRLHLYDASPTAILDNAAFDIPAGDRASYLGFIDLVTPVDMGSTLVSQNTGLNRPLKLAAGATSLYGLLVTTGGFTPTSAEAYRLILKTRTGV